MPKKNMTIEDLAKLMNKRLGTVSQHFDKKIEDEVGNLAGMDQREFLKIHQKIDGMDKRLGKQIENLQKEHFAHDFKMTEMVHKADYYKLEERVGKIELKLGLKV